MRSELETMNKSYTETVTEVLERLSKMKGSVEKQGNTFPVSALAIWAILWGLLEIVIDVFTII